MFGDNTPRGQPFTVAHRHLQYAFIGSERHAFQPLSGLCTALLLKSYIQEQGRITGDWRYDTHPDQQHAIYSHSIGQIGSPGLVYLESYN